MLIDKPQDQIQLRPAEPPGAFKRNWIQPDLSDHVLASDVNVRRLASIQRDKENRYGPIRSTVGTGPVSHCSALTANGRGLSVAFDCNLEPWLFVHIHISFRRMVENETTNSDIDWVTSSRRSHSGRSVGTRRHGPFRPKGRRAQSSSSG